MKAEGQVTLVRATEGCASAVDLCLRGTVAGKGGFFDGAVWLFTALARTASAPKESFVGRTVITTRTGTLTGDTEATVEDGGLTLVDRIIGADVKEPRLMGAREIFQRGSGLISTRGSGSLDRGVPAELTGEVCLGK